MTVREGQKVSWTGLPGERGLQIGDMGKALSVAGRGVHVMWATGALAGQTELHHDYDLAVVGSHYTVEASIDESLDVGGLTAFSARNTFDEGGEVAVLNAMVDAGHLAVFSEIAEEAIGLIEARIRHDASFRKITSELDDEEAEALVRMASVVLIRDAFGADDEA